jgi:hypothetical protein
MTLAVLGSARGAPGVTTLAVAVTAWLERGVLVEVDPNGGVLAPRYRLGREPGLVTLAAARGGERIRDHAQRLPGGTPAVVAPEASDRVWHVWQTAGAALAHRLTSEDDADIVVDAGRFSPSTPVLPLIPHASVVAVVARPIAEQLFAAAERIRILRRDNEHVGMVLVGDGPYSARDVSEELDCEVFATVAQDPRAAEALAYGGGRRHLGRSALVRSARAVAEAIADRSTGASVPLVDRVRLVEGATR